MKIIDHCLDSFLADELERIFLDPYTSWFYDLTTVGKQSNNLDLTKFYETFQLIHPIADNGRHDSPYTPAVLRVPDKIFFDHNIDILNYRRIKVNQLTKSVEANNKSHPPHVDDAADNMISLIYYINDADGPTYFFNHQKECVYRVDPKKNRCVIFASNILHASSSPVIADRRLVINVVASTSQQILATTINNRTS